MSRHLLSWSAVKSVTPEGASLFRPTPWGPGKKFIGHGIHGNTWMKDISVRLFSALLSEVMPVNRT
jgi:hypothetical protein